MHTVIRFQHKLQKISELYISPRGKDIIEFLSNIGQLFLIVQV